jgi:hypothetical protein
MPSLTVSSVTELSPPSPGPLQVAIDFNEALQPTVAQNIALYKIAQENSNSLPIKSAVYSDSNSVHQVVLTVPSGTSVIPGSYHVLINAANLIATNGDTGAPKVDQLWVDVTGENTLKPITVQPDGSFAVSGSGQSLGYPPPIQVVAGNFTGGSYPDLMVLTAGESRVFGGDDAQIVLLRNTGNGTYAAPVPISVQGPSPVQVAVRGSISPFIQSIAAVDWNHDGHTDLVVATINELNGNVTSYSYYILLNDGHGNFTDAPQTPIPISANAPASPFAVYDLSGNGQYEIIHLGPPTKNGSTLEVIGKDPNVGYTPQMELPWNNGDGFAEIEFADVNEDGKPDIITRDSGYYGDADNFTVILSTPSGYAPGVQYHDTIDLGGTSGDLPRFNPRAVGVGNFSGSGHLDIAAVFGNGNALSASDIILFENDGKGNFTEQQPIHLAYGNYNTTAATFGDLNGTGIPDLVMTTTVNGQFTVWTLRADGHGGFVPTTPAPVPQTTTDPSTPFAITLADLDGDGHLDVIASGGGGGEIRLAINDGTGTMRPLATALPSTGAWGPSATNLAHPQQVFADFANDGRLGFATISQGGMDVYLAQSDGTFMHTAFLGDNYAGVGLTTPPFVAVGDLNNDGIPDIVTYGVVYLGNGDGTFRQPIAIPVKPGGDYVKNITLADVNHDGNLDAVATLIGNGTGHFFGVFFGDGKGDLTFNANTLIPAQFSGNAGINDPVAGLGDFNGDGNLDLIVPVKNSSTGVTSLTDYLGAGNGTFSPGPVFDTNDYDKILVGDLNGDGHSDLVVLNSSFVATVYLGDGQGGFTKATTFNLSMSNDPLYGFAIPPSDLALGDFNGDGKLDLAVSYSTTPDVVDMYLGDGTGHFAAPQAITVGDGPATLVTVPRAPFLDAGTFAVTDQPPTAGNVTINATSGSSAIIPVLNFATNPGGSPLTLVQVTSPSHGVAHITPDPSGKSGNDVIVYTSTLGFTGADSFTYTIEDAAGVQSMATVTVTVASASTGPAGQFQFNPSAYSDTEGNGFATITVTRTNGSSGSVTVHYATSDGSAKAGIDYTATSGDLAFADGQTSATFAIPILNDGLSDGSETVNLTLSSPTGGAALGSPANAVLTLNDVGTIAVSQFDIVGRVNGTGQWWLGQSNGSGFTNQLSDLWSPAVTWVDVHTGDFNGDGHQDIVGRVLETGQWWVALSNGSNGFTNTLWTTWNPNVTWVDVQVGDFNGDGKADIIGRFLQTGQWWVAQSTGSSFTNSLWATWNPAVTWVDVKVGNFSGDGKADIAGRWLQGGSWWTGVSNGTSFSTSLWTTWNPNVTWVDVNVGDFNGDGKADIVGRWLQGGQWWVAQSTGSSFINSLWATWNPNVTWVDVKVGDFNGDGMTDITGRWLQGGSWWTGISTGSSFNTSMWASWNPAVTWVDVQVGDFNSDGKMDIAGRWLQGGSWWTGVSTGSAFTTTLWAQWSSAVTWVDVRDGAFV